jgi:hypothetical protein
VSQSFKFWVTRGVHQAKETSTVFVGILRPPCIKFGQDIGNRS